MRTTAIPFHSWRQAKGRLRRWLGAPNDRTTSHPEPAIERVNGYSIIVLPGVFNGILYHTGAFLAETLSPELIQSDASVLDLGTGSGVCAVFAARRAARVVATDINPEAVRCAQINVLAHHLEGVVETRGGDLFEPVRDERFDLILFNPPYFRGRPSDSADQALRSPDAFERFLRQFPRHLTSRGRAVVVLSPDTDIEQSLWESGLSIAVLRTRRVRDKTLSIYEVAAP